MRSHRSEKHNDGDDKQRKAASPNIEFGAVVHCHKAGQLYMSWRCDLLQKASGKASHSLPPGVA
jgi:hypothetical protein